jgi:hypothetical protein
MADLSFNTEKLTEMANELGKEAKDYQTEAIPKVHKLGIPVNAFPLFGIGFAHSYQQLQQAAEDATRAMGKTVESMAEALGTVATYYQQMEEQQGQDFDTGAKITAKIEKRHG